MSAQSIDRRLQKLETREATQHVYFVWECDEENVRDEIAKIEALDPDAEIFIFSWL